MLTWTSSDCTGKPHMGILSNPDLFSKQKLINMFIEFFDMNQDRSAGKKGKRDRSGDYCAIKSKGRYANSG